MKMNKKDQRELHAMLDEALDRVLKGEDINIVLADYPRFADEFAPLLRTAGDTRKAVDIKPRPEFRQRAALDFQKAIQAMPVKPVTNKPVSRWRLAWVMPVAVFAALIMSGTGLVAASNNSLPGSPLYSVKLAAENVQMAFTPSSLNKAELYAKFNDRRVGELVAIAANTDGVELAAEIDTLNTRMASNMAEISELTGGNNAIATSGSMNIMAVPEKSLGYSDASDTTMPAATTTVAITQTVTSQSTATVTTTQPDRPVTTDVTIPPTTVTGIIPPAVATNASEEAYGLGGTRNRGVLTDEEQKLMALLTEKQQENLERLESAWEKAPDWLKPLIRRAIDIILYGYDTSISNLAY